MDGWTYQPMSEKQKRAAGRRWNRLFSVWHWLIQPEFEGFENIPEKGPVLFVGNHSLMAFADAVLMFREIYNRKGIVCRSLGLHAHFTVPIWGKLLAANGAVDGTRENCTALMQSGEYTVVYPGGGGEVMKRKGEQHTLRWKGRTGFARMAIENGCTIVPFSTVGADDCFDILYDNEQMQQFGWLRKLISLSRIKSEEIPPVVRGWGPTLFPRPEKMYFKFHEPIEAGYFADTDMEKAAWALRELVENTVQEGMDALLIKREADQNRPLLARLKNKVFAG